MAFHVTQCPGCESTFNTTARILQSAAGKVRCGACLTVFNAVDYLIDDHNADDTDDTSVFVGSNPNDYFDPSRFISRSALTEPDPEPELEPEFESDFGSALDDEFDDAIDETSMPVVDSELPVEHSMSDWNQADEFTASDDVDIPEQTGEFDAAITVDITEDDDSVSPAIHTDDDLTTETATESPPEYTPGTLTESNDADTLTIDSEEVPEPSAEPAAVVADISDSDNQTPEQESLADNAPPVPTANPYSRAPEPTSQTWTRPAPEDLRIHASFSIFPAPPREAETAQPEPPASETQPTELTEDTEINFDLDASPESPEYFEITEVSPAASDTLSDSSDADTAYHDAATPEVTDPPLADTDNHSNTLESDSEKQAESQDSELKDSEDKVLLTSESVLAADEHDPVEPDSDDSTIFYLDEFDEVDEPAELSSPLDTTPVADVPPESDEQEAEISQHAETPAALTDNLAVAKPEPAAPPKPTPSEPADESVAAIRARALRTELRDDDALEALPDTARSVIGQHLPPLELISGQERRWLQQAFLITACAVLGLLLAGQFLWQQLPVYSRVAQYRPVYEFACEYLGCSLPTYSEISAIRSGNLVVRSHPTVDNALSVSLNFRNTAAFPQPFPILILSFNSATNAVIALREFAPAEYLDAGLRDIALMPVMSPVQIELDIVDPGADAVNYTVAFRRP